MAVGPTAQAKANQKGQAKEVSSDMLLSSYFIFTAFAQAAHAMLPEISPFPSLETSPLVSPSLHANPRSRKPTVLANPRIRRLRR